MTVFKKLVIRSLQLRIRCFMITSYQAALLILRAHEAYQAESDRALTRFRLSRKTMRRLSGRTNLRDAFIDDVKEEMIEFGWAMFPVGDQYALLKLDRVDSWQRIAAGRIASELRNAIESPDSFDFDSLEDRFLARVDDEVDD